MMLTSANCEQEQLLLLARHLASQLVAIEPQCLIFVTTLLGWLSCKLLASVQFYGFTHRVGCFLQLAASLSGVFKKQSCL